MTFPLMDRTRRLTEEALGEAGLSLEPARAASCWSAGRRGCRWSARTSRRWPAQAPRAGVNVDEVVALGAAIQAAMEEGRRPPTRRPVHARRQACAAFTLAGARRVTDVMSHSLGAVAVSPDGSAYVNDIVIRRNLPIPAENTKSYLHATHGGANDAAGGLPDPGRERRAARLLGPRQVRLLGHPADRRRGDGRRRDVLRRQRRRPGPGRPARHRARAGDDRRAGPRRPLVARPAAGSRRDSSRGRARSRSTC